MNVALQVLPYINAIYGCNLQIPKLNIRLDKFYYAGGIGPVILLHSGLVEGCIFPQQPKVIEILGDHFKGFECEGFAGIASMMWVLAHEWMHQVRMHTEVIAELGNSQSILHALEYDSDLCAAAVVFRFVQTEVNKNTVDADIRQLTVFFLFWGIRHFKSDNGTDTHPPLHVRFFNILLKVATLNTDPYGKPDNSFENAQSRNHREDLIQVFYKCEEYYSKHYATDVEDKSLITKFAEYMNSPNCDQLIADWLAISPTVERLSKTKAVSNVSGGPDGSFI